ncbi:MAG: hypothetical protein ACWGSQ_03625, partial [Longimicrobiales bacterium]
YDGLPVEDWRLVGKEGEALGEIARGVVDHIFLRVLQVGAVLVLLTFLGVWILGRARKPSLRRDAG